VCGQAGESFRICLKNSGVLVSLQKFQNRNKDGDRFLLSLLVVVKVKSVSVVIKILARSRLLRFLNWKLYVIGKVNWDMLQGKTEMKTCKMKLETVIQEIQNGNTFL